MVDSSLNRRINPSAGRQMKQMVKSHLGPQSTGGASTPNPSTLSPVESAQNYKIASRLNAKNFMGNVYSRIVLPHDTAKSQPGREAEYWRQSAMPWGSAFMSTPTDAQRLNNPSQSSFTKQRQLSIPNTYGQFYAFMHALSAAFGNLQQGQ
jgi:hypothetical protein